MSANVFLTGGTGFIGTVLRKALVARGHKVATAEFDLLDAMSLRDQFESEKWSHVIHLASISSNSGCEKDPSLAFRVNVAGTALLASQLTQACPGAHLVFASSALVYDTIRLNSQGSDFEIEESFPVNPHGTYAETKWQSELILKDTSLRKDLKTTVLRLFNHTHHSQKPDFFLPHLYTQMKAAGAGKEVTIPVGNLDIDRDFGVVPDLINAFVHLIESEAGPSENYNVFNVSSGQARNLKQVAHALAEQLGVRAQFHTDPARVRAGGPIRVCGSHKQFSRRFGWHPTKMNNEAFVRAFLEPIES